MLTRARESQPRRAARSRALEENPFVASPMTLHPAQEFGAAGALGAILPAIHRGHANGWTLRERARGLLGCGSGGCGRPVKGMVEFDKATSRWAIPLRKLLQAAQSDWSMHRSLRVRDSDKLLMAGTF